MTADIWRVIHSDGETPCDGCAEIRAPFHLIFARPDRPDHWFCLKCTSVQIPAHGARRCPGCGDPLARGRRERCIDCHRQRMEHIP